MSTNMATIRTHQPEYTIPAKRPSYWYCKSLDCRLSAPSDLWGLERETLLTIKAELEKASSDLSAQAHAESSRHYKEMDRIVALRSLVVSLIHATHQEVRESKKRALDEKNSRWERAFVDAAKGSLDKDTYLSLVDQASASIDPLIS